MLQHVEHQHAPETGVRDRQILGFRLYRGYTEVAVKLHQTFGAEVQRECTPPLGQQQACVNSSTAADVENALIEARRAVPQESKHQLTAPLEPEMATLD